MLQKPNENCEATPLPNLQNVQKKGLALALLASSACGPGALAEGIRPDDPTVADANGGEATDPDNPFIGDWEGYRLDKLEVAMEEGAAVISYDCNSARLLPDCKLDGDYEFLSTSSREENIELKNTKKVRAALSTHGISLEADLKEGSLLKLRTKTVGMLRLTRKNVSRELLRGKCEGATHIVRSATIGALSLETNTLGEVAGKTPIAEANGSSEKTGGSTSGNMKACHESSVDEKLHKQCRTPLWLHLEDIDGDRNSCGTKIPSAKGVNDEENGQEANSKLNYGMDASFFNVFASEQTNPLFYTAGGSLSYNIDKGFSFNTGAGLIHSIKGGVADHYSELDEGSSRMSAYARLGLGIHPRFSRSMGMNISANGMLLFNGGNGTFLETGPEFYLGSKKSTVLSASLMGGYLTWDKAMGDNPTTPRIEDPIAKGGLLGGNLRLEF